MNGERIAFAVHTINTRGRESWFTGFFRGDSGGAIPAPHDCFLEYSAPRSRLVPPADRRADCRRG